MQFLKLLRFVLQKQYTKFKISFKLPALVVIVFNWKNNKVFCCFSYFKNTNELILKTLKQAVTVKNAQSFTFIYYNLCF